MNERTSKETEKKQKKVKFNNNKTAAQNLYVRLSGKMISLKFCLNKIKKISLTFFCLNYLDPSMFILVSYCWVSVVIHKCCVEKWTDFHSKHGNISKHYNNIVLLLPTSIQNGDFRRLTSNASRPVFSPFLYCYVIARFQWLSVLKVD